MRVFCFLAALLAAVSSTQVNAQGCSGGQATFSATSGCSGGQAILGQFQPVRAIVAARPLRSGLAAINEARPHVLGHLFGAVADAHHARVAARSAGCSGGTAMSTTFISTNTVATGCSGGGPTGYVRMPRTGAAKTVIVVPAVQVAPAAPMAAAMQAGPLRRALLRAELNHAINHAERTGKLSAADAAKARAVMADPELRGQALAKVEAQGPTASADSQHPFLEWLVQNLPAIIAEILKLFGH